VEEDRTEETVKIAKNMGKPNQRLIEPPRRFIMKIKPTLGFYGRFIYR